MDDDDGDGASGVGGEEDKESEGRGKGPIHYIFENKGHSSFLPFRERIKEGDED